MYIRTTSRTNKDGSVAEYVQLAHNYRDPVSGQSKPKILFSFGRRDALDEDALRRLVDSIARFLGPADELTAAITKRRAQPMLFVESRPMGAAWLLRDLWRQLGVAGTLARQAKEKGVADPAGVIGCIFAMVANRALAPKSKHATPEWLAVEAFVPDVPEDVYDERLYRAMDFLLAASDEVQRAVFFACANLLNLDVGLLLYDTTSAWFAMEDDDGERADRAERWEAFDAGEGAEPTRPRPAVAGSGQGARRAASRRHGSGDYERRHPVRRGRGAGLQAARGGRTGAAVADERPGPAADVPPQGRSHPRPCALVLACAAARPDSICATRPPRRSVYESHADIVATRRCRQDRQ